MVFIGSKNTKSMPQLAPERPFKPAHLRANKIKTANNGRSNLIFFHSKNYGYSFAQNHF